MALTISILMVMFLSSVAVAKDKVTVYTSLETDETVKYLEVARKDLPDLDIDIIRLSTGESVHECWPRKTILKPTVSGDGP